MTLLRLLGSGLVWVTQTLWAGHPCVPQCPSLQRTGRSSILMRPPPPTDPHLLSRLWALCLFPKVFQDRNKNNGICEADFVYSQVSWLSVITFFFPNVEVFLRMSWGRADINLGRGQRAYGPQCHANNSSCPFLRTWKNGREEETCLATRSSVPLIRASCQLLEKCWLCFTN